MNNISSITAILLLLLSSCSNNNESIIAEFKTEHFKISISNTGSVNELTDLNTDKNYLAKDTSTYILSIRVNNEMKVPQSAHVEEEMIVLAFEDDIEARLKVEEKTTHLNFEMTSITDPVDLILWGPLLYHNKQNHWGDRWRCSWRRICNRYSISKH